MSVIDYAIIFGYFILVVGVGIYAGRRERNIGDFLVGGRSVPWPAVLGSIVATEVSAATFLAVPGVGFAENLNYLQFGVGSVLARVFIAIFFLGAFYQAQCFSIYEYLRQRFGECSHYTASIYFLITRLLASGVRLMIAATGVSVIMDVSLWICLLVFAVLTIIYTATGGIKAVIWTDCIQGVVFISAGIAVLWFVLKQLGWELFISTAGEAGRLEVFRFQVPDSDNIWTTISDPQWFWIAVLFGFVSSAAAFGCDQDSTQRMLSCKDARRARLSLVCSGFISIPIAFLFLMVGVALYVYFQIQPNAQLPEEADKAFPFFIANELPTGMKGLLLAGVLAAAMSSLDSAMAALGSSALVDLIRPLSRDRISVRGLLWFSRGLTILFAVLIVAIAWKLQDGGQFLWLAFQITSITYSGLLGVFLLGLLTRRGNDRLNLLAMIVGSVVVAVLLFLNSRGYSNIGWTWFLFLGTSMTFLVGCLGRGEVGKAD